MAPTAAVIPGVRTLEQRAGRGVCWISIKGINDTKQVDEFLKKGAEVAGTPFPTHHNVNGCRCVNFMDGTREQLDALVSALQKLESRMLPKGTVRLKAGEAFPEGAGSYVRYNT